MMTKVKCNRAERVLEKSEIENLFVLLLLLLNVFLLFSTFVFQFHSLFYTISSNLYTKKKEIKDLELLIFFLIVFFFVFSLRLLLLKSWIGLYFCNKEIRHHTITALIDLYSVVFE